MLTAIYGRVSTNEQNAGMQLDELRAYCHRRQWEIVEEFIDAGVSGSKESRPALNRLLKDAKRRKFDAVLVYRYDRFARSLRQMVNTLTEFDALGIHFVSLHEGVDTQHTERPTRVRHLPVDRGVRKGADSRTSTLGNGSCESERSSAWQTTPQRGSLGCSRPTQRRNEPPSDRRTTAMLRRIGAKDAHCVKNPSR